MAVWQQDGYIKAWNFASAAHTGQKVPGTELPYINHIGLVAMETMTAISEDSDQIKNPSLLVVCALLHDTIEDTDCTYEQLIEQFGAEIAEGVLALSKNKSLPSKGAQMEDSLERIRRQPKEIWMVKLSDRITNLQPPPKHWDHDKIDRYRNEAKLILEGLGEANDYLAGRLAEKIEAYRQYL